MKKKRVVCFRTWFAKVLYYIFVSTKRDNNNLKQNKMKTQNFDNDTITLTLNKVSENSNAIYSHYFTVIFNDDNDSDDVAIDVNSCNDFKSWLEDNCDIEGTEENVELFKNLLK